MFVRLAYISNAQAGYYKCYMKTRRQTKCDCGWSVNQKIVNGVTTGVNEYPSVVGIVDSTIQQIVCGGTIISEKYILGAAHCVNVLKLGSIVALVGDHNINTGSETPYSAVYLISSVIIHPSYNSNSKQNDIALFMTNKDILFSRGVGPACLPWNYATTSFTGYKVDIAGWGSTSFGGPVSSVLKKVILTTVANSECSSKLQVQMSNTQMCTFTKGKDTCQYDSGAGLFLRYSRMFLIGVVSYGSACYGEKPSVNTQVAPYLNWIRSSTQNQLFCNKNIN